MTKLHFRKGSKPKGTDRLFGMGQESAGGPVFQQAAEGGADDLFVAAPGHGAQIVDLRQIPVDRNPAHSPLTVTGGACGAAAGGRSSGGGPRTKVKSKLIRQRNPLISLGLTKRPSSDAAGPGNTSPRGWPRGVRPPLDAAAGLPPLAAGYLGAEFISGAPKCPAFGPESRKRRNVRPCQPANPPAARSPRPA